MPTTLHRYMIDPLPVIPEGSQMMIHGNYAKIDDNGILWIFSKSLQEFYSTRRTLSDYNDYVVKSYDEYTLSDIISYYTKNEINKDYYIFCDDGKYCFSYYKPVVKGNKLRAGEKFSIDHVKFPQIKQHFIGLSSFEFIEINSN